MDDAGDSALDGAQVEWIEKALHHGSEQASRQLATWLERRSVIELDALRIAPLAEATELLSAGEEPICFCAMAMTGQIGGQLILVFDDQSGFQLADMVLFQPRGSTTVWTEMAQSAVLETANIVCCAYLNALSERISRTHKSISLVPSPPTFSRDFAQSLLQFALMDQAMEFDQVILAQTRFEVEGEPVRLSLLFVPDRMSMRHLAELLDTPKHGDSTSSETHRT